ncbi:MAG: 50S ribosomal protein L17 [Patescibacteria group bacterium]|nr:50S ribosomal protein L17 [Patescibacteria group bacterium]MCL5431768.1 50S ribosomal protein L17 [Patescibacteria group bacterium]
MNTNQAKARRRGLVSALFERGKIETTVAGAKSVAGLADKLMGLAKKNTVASRRQAIKILGGDRLIAKIFGEVAPKYANRQSGYTRLIRLGQRFSDTAEMGILEFVEGTEPKPEPTQKAKSQKSKIKSSS